MKGLLRLLPLLLATLLCTSGHAQHNISAGLLAKVPVTTLPSQDNDRLLREELAQRRKGRPNTFAVTIPTTLRPTNSGTWVDRNGSSTWLLRLHSEGAKTLNLGFSEYHLPEGAEFYITTGEEKLGPFTAADNADHNQLWTPIVRGDELLLELSVPTNKKKGIQLYLTSVNHDFIDVTKSLSGSCNLDVICGQVDGWDIVDDYRDIIRSVAAYTLNGVDQCTGFLVNNANQDGAPFFMTANHCNVRAANDQTLVAYWNFQSPQCRQPFSDASGLLGFGSRSIANLGTRYLASSANSDMCLTILEEPVVAGADEFYAGWSLDPLAPTDTVIAIHHPGVDEKRISFTFNEVTRTSVDPFTLDPTGRFVVVSSWSIGTTEGGSSGSPLFDRDKRVRGQLWRGAAACGNPDGYDQYGFFTSSWEGDGTPATRLKDWLDPCGTGLTEIDGFDNSNIPFLLTATENCIENCALNESRIPLTLGSGFPTGTQFSIVSATPGISPILTAATGAGGQTIELVLPANQVTPTGIYTVTVRATGGGRSDETTLTIDLFAGTLAAPTVLEPIDGAEEVSPLTLFAWAPMMEADGYDFQVSSSSDFNPLIANGNNLTGTAYTLDIALLPMTTYYWRVRTLGPCGPGEWATYSFLTSSESCGVQESTSVPVAITTSGTPTVTASLDIMTGVSLTELEVFVKIDHTYVGDLSATLTAPDGQTIQLFESPLAGSCGGSNIEVTFSDNATRTSGEFVDNCTGNALSHSGAYQPAEPFTTFTDLNTFGTWTLTVSDNAGEDGGAIRAFTMNYCGSPEEVPDYTVTSPDAAWESCVENAAAFDLALGTSFGEDIEIVVTTQGITLTDYTVAFSQDNTIATLTFNSWPDAAIGEREVTVTVTAEDGTARVITIPLFLYQAAEPAMLVEPTSGQAIVTDTGVDFSWVRSPGAESFTLEISEADDFSAPILRAETMLTDTTILDLPTGVTLYWRVVSNNEACGTATSENRSFTFRSTGVRDFTGGRSIAIYPNPVSNQLTVALEGNWSGEIGGQLFDATGRTVRSYRIMGAARSLWDVSALPEGLYFLRVSTGGEAYTERIVITR